MSNKNQCLLLAEHLVTPGPAEKSRIPVGRGRGSHAAHRALSLGTRDVPEVRRLVSRGWGSHGPGRLSGDPPPQCRLPQGHVSPREVSRSSCFSVKGASRVARTAVARTRAVDKYWPFGPPD